MILIVVKFPAMSEQGNDSIEAMRLPALEFSSGSSTASSNIAALRTTTRRNSSGIDKRNSTNFNDFGLTQAERRTTGNARDCSTDTLDSDLPSPSAPARFLYFPRRGQHRSGRNNTPLHHRHWMRELQLAIRQAEEKTPPRTRENRRLMTTSIIDIS
ncbi:hypothetical protein V7R84_12565 [Arachnia propionica]|uniref:hypothetical protein n=1 Tax=Arachnia propionica TaxID=1750 RepID=UPI0030CC0A0C